MEQLEAITSNVCLSRCSVGRCAWCGTRNWNDMWQLLHWRCSPHPKSSYREHVDEILAHCCQYELLPKAKQLNENPTCRFLFFVLPQEWNGFFIAVRRCQEGIGWTGGGVGALLWWRRSGSVVGHHGVRNEKCIVHDESCVLEVVAMEARILRSDGWRTTC